MTLLRHFPYEKARAARNMALDAAMLAEGRSEDLVFWRFYGWTGPAVTFGYSQHWDWVNRQLGSFEGDCIRRITGGGIVDHRQDLTYAMTIPATHSLYRQPALDIYKSLHAGLAGILSKFKIRSSLAPCPGPCEQKDPQKPGVCYQSAEPYDVVNPETGMKIAGAAMKRNRNGVLVQGSIWPTGPEFPDCKALAQPFGQFLADWLETGKSLQTTPMRREAVDEEEIRFSSKEWNFRR